MEDLDDADVEILPDNLGAVRVFTALGTQWRVGNAGAIGLDYSTLPVVMRLLGVRRADWPDTFDSIRVMEAEALAVFGEERG
ncbi:DUF1799 domain-containing protein [Lysobacter enzymogenes]|nr:DUF1799 domain-containing protein [Lysobacter enzymogenes]